MLHLKKNKNEGLNCEQLAPISLHQRRFMQIITKIFFLKKLLQFYKIRFKKKKKVAVPQALTFTKLCRNLKLLAA